MKSFSFGGALLACAMLTACGGQAGSNPQKIADDMTRSVYADDTAALAAHFDDKTKVTVTRSDVGALSDKMHQLGDLQSLVQHAAKPDEGRYTYDATFSHGSMLIELRVDPSGSVGAYRVIPQAPPAAKTAG